MLRITCTNCHMPFILNRDALGAALDEVHREGYKHYNAYCSNCGQQNKVSRKQLQRVAPWWKAPAAAKAKSAAPKAKSAAPEKKKPASKSKSKAAAKASSAKKPASTKKKAPTKSKAKASKTTAKARK